MIVPATEPSRDDLSDLPAWQRGLVRARWILAGLYFLGLAGMFGATYFDHSLLQIYPDNEGPLFHIVVGTVFFGMQALLLSGAPHFRWPRPTRRRWMYLSIAAASLMAGLLTLGLAATIVSLVGKSADALWSLTPFLAVILIPWAAWFLVFSLLWKGTWERKFSRIRRLLLAGTWLELLITIPVDLSVRRRT